MLNLTSSIAWVSSLIIGFASVAVIQSGYVASNTSVKEQSVVRLIQEKKTSSSIKGIINGTDGKPVAKLQVRLLVENAASARDPKSVQPTGLIQGRMKPVATTTTDEAGKFSFKEIKQIGDYHVQAGNPTIGRVSTLLAVDEIGVEVDAGTLKLAPSAK